jgi:uncharacterized damage-inducible protein DinB
MSLKDAALSDLEQELTTTRRMLERVPDGRMAWKPHEKSMTLGRLSMHLAELPASAQRVLTTDSFHFLAPGQPPPARREATTVAEALETFDANVALLRAALDSVDDATLQKPWTLLRAGQEVSTDPKLTALRRRGISHMIHHRAQLGVYLRLLDIPIPGSYGPSADEG